jgi:hypothetical protein
MVDRPLMHGIGWPAGGGDPAVCKVRGLIELTWCCVRGGTPSGQAANRCESRAVTGGSRAAGASCHRRGGEPAARATSLHYHNAADLLPFSGLIRTARFQKYMTEHNYR